MPVVEFSWGGAYHTQYWVDPVEKLTVVYMTQVIPAPGLDDFGKVRALVYQAIDGHSHTLVEEVVVVRSGKGRIQIERETFDLFPGSVAVVPPGRFHALCNTGSVNFEGVAVFNSKVDREAVVLKSREEHFGT